MPSEIWAESLIVGASSCRYGRGESHGRGEAKRISLGDCTVDVLRGKRRQLRVQRRGLVATLVVALVFAGAVSAVAAVVDRTPPAVSSVRVSSLSATKAVVAWHTNEPASGYVDDGRPPSTRRARSGTTSTSRTMP